MNIIMSRTLQLAAPPSSLLERQRMSLHATMRKISIKLTTLTTLFRQINQNLIMLKRRLVFIAPQIDIISIIADQIKQLKESWTINLPEIIKDVVFQRVLDTEITVLKPLKQVCTICPHGDVNHERIVLRINLMPISSTSNNPSKQDPWPPWQLRTETVQLFTGVVPQMTALTRVTKDPNAFLMATAQIET